MTPQARSFALRAAAKVALAGAAAGATGCDHPEPHVSIPAAPPGASEAQPVVARGPTTAAPKTSGCSVSAPDHPSAGELACCAARVAADDDGGVGYMTYADAQHRRDAGPPSTPETRACCAAFFHETQGVRTDPNGSASKAWEARRWSCCTAFLDDPDARKMAGGRCTPWGPPTPPSMDWV